MTGLTQAEFGLALIAAGMLLMFFRHWRFFLVLFIAMLFMGRK